ncbi:hypothetical protein [Paenibacillus gallinarum]|uniref:Uncharacterized protein n=1 Tax=Paenibacillus gallinarum TaxID=2762232 RepID=A0ABR8T5Q8_9BACL|nr:hypothetical protein [Paenibacillus gallinarum]MBD7971101.1 hypothetical protein [Paenibacillus gallinarum]
MKLKSIRFESICKEFAGKLYPLLTEDDKDYLFYEDGELQESILMIQELEHIWEIAAVPSLKLAESSLTDRQYKNLCRRYNFESNRDIYDIAMEKVEQLLEERHKDFLKNKNDSSVN